MFGTKRLDRKAKGDEIARELARIEAQHAADKKEEGRCGIRLSLTSCGSG